jgi:hypothetical protein
VDRFSEDISKRSHKKQTYKWHHHGVMISQNVLVYKHEQIGDLMGYIMNNVISAMLFYAVSCLLTKKLPRIKGLVPIYFGRFTFVDSRRASAHQRTTSTWLPMLILFTIASSQN